MSTNKEVVNKGISFENNTYPFRFYQTGVLTDSDRAVFPYRNWYRGQYMSPFPIIADREAGFYPRIYPYPSYDYYANNPWGGYYDYNYNAYYPHHRFWGAAKQPRFLDIPSSSNVGIVRPGTNRPGTNSQRMMITGRDQPLFLYR